MTEHLTENHIYTKMSHTDIDIDDNNVSEEISKVSEDPLESSDAIISMETNTSEAHATAGSGECDSLLRDMSDQDRERDRDRERDQEQTGNDQQQGGDVDDASTRSSRELGTTNNDSTTTLLVNPISSPKRVLSPKHLSDGSTSFGAVHTFETSDTIETHDTSPSSPFASSSTCGGTQPSSDSPSTPHPGEPVRTRE
jgi:hypothetical protein